VVEGPQPANLVFQSDPGAPVTASRGREAAILLNPYTGAVIQDASAGLHDAFHVIEDWHRRMGGEGSSVRAWLIDWGNLLFLFIVVSGIYIWLPQVWRWRTLRGLMFFQRKYINGKVRDFNWHHVFAFWMLIPLFLISLSGVVMSFPWANKMLFAAYGEQPPQRGGPPGGAGQRAGGPDAPQDTSPRASLESLRTAAVAQVPQWQRLTLPLAARGPQVEVAVDLKSDLRRPPRQTVTFDAADGSVVKLSPVQGAATQTPAQRARSWMRFIHTGEEYGIVGQTIAGLASLAACFLVYTGLALAWRRLIRPLFRRREAPGPLTAAARD
jgi:uncharacterized iron-regulated membrane protein